MPRKRTKDKGLPERVYKRGPSYYYADQSGKWLNLGKNLRDALIAHAEIIGSADDYRTKKIVTVNQAIDRYMAEVSPTKAASTHESELKRSKTLRKRYGHMRLDQVTQRAIYEVMDKRSSEGHEVSANRELALLSHMYKKAIRWGAVDINPCTGIERFKESPRERYIDDIEFNAFKLHAGPQIAAYMDFKLLTGLRQGDILKLKRNDLMDDGIHVTISKTGQKIIIGWTTHLQAAVDQLLALHKPLVTSLYLLCTRRGQPYTSDGFRSIWQRKMKSALAEKVLTERFRDHDIRAKTGSDTDLDHASNLLAHLDRKTTQRHYRRKPNKVNPLK